VWSLLYAIVGGTVAVFLYGFVVTVRLLGAWLEKIAHRGE
jgi:hypothetical protein